MNGREVGGVFEFGAAGLPVAFHAERQRDLGGGRSALTPWDGRYGDHRAVDGVLAFRQ